MLSIKNIRKISGLSRKDFCELYSIPITTLSKWEAKETSHNHRNCPKYINLLLERAVKEDFKE